MAPIYSYVTYATARQQLANRLADTNKVFFTDAELKLYLIESLRTWNALTSYWRGDFTFPTTNATVWYDITNTTTAPLTSRSLNVTDVDLYTIIQFHLLEPAVGVNPWSGASSQFSADDLIQAVNRRRDEILGITGCTLTRSLVGAAAGRTQLSDSTIDIRRMAYLPNSPNKPSIVWPDDTWSLQAFQNTYLQSSPGTPQMYLLNTEPPISFDVDRAPAFGGNYELLTVNAGTPLIFNAVNKLSIPDDWTDLIKWGALADLLGRESNAKDLPRSKYCELRYRMGLAALSNAAAILAIRLGNVPLQLDSVVELDTYQPGWQAATAATPTQAVTAGLNLIGLSPTPNASPYSLTATVVQNAPIPSLDGDFLQCGRDEYDVILDYAQHLAMFKTGGLEFASTAPLLRRFLMLAATYNSKLRELGEFTTALLARSPEQERHAPRLNTDLESITSAAGDDTNG